MRHLANLHGSLLGFTVEQRSRNLGHSPTMNQKYDKHRSLEVELEFLSAPLSIEQKLKQEIEKLKEENLFLKKRITELEIELNGGEGITKLF